MYLDSRGRSCNNNTRVRLHRPPLSPADSRTRCAKEHPPPTQSPTLHAAGRKRVRTKLALAILMTYASGCSTIAARAPDASDGKGDAYDNAPMMSVSSASQIMRCVRRRPDKKGRAPICCRGSRASTYITFVSEGHAGRAAGLRAFREISPVMYRYCTNGAASTRRAIASSVTSPER